MEELSSPSSPTGDNDTRYQIIEHFLTDQECMQLIAISGPRLVPSEGWSVDAGKSEITSYRTSKQVFFVRRENQLIADIEKRIAMLTGIPEENGEGLQVVMYEKGGHYYDHNDSFDPTFDGNRPVLNRGGQRIITVLIYLNDLAQDGSDGGATCFPRIDLQVYPKKGRALMWWNVKEDGRTVDPNTLHRGEDLLTDKKQKWICTKWLRQGVFV